MDLNDIKSLEWSEVFALINTFLKYPLFELGENSVTVKHLIIFLVFITCFFILGSIIRRFLLKRVFKKFNLERGLQYTLARISQYFVVVIGFLIALEFIGMDLTSLAVVFSLLSVGIGFGLQNITANFISGLIIMFERPISVGDRVKVAGVEGDVTEINIRSTNIKTLKNITIIVPNTQFVENNVINYSHGDSSFRLDIEVGVSYSSDLDTVIKALDEVVSEQKDKLNIRKHEVHLIEFGDSSWNMQLRIWIADVRDRYDLRNMFNQTVVRKFDKYDIEIPFPQRDLHLKSGQKNNPIVISTDKSDSSEKKETGNENTDEKQSDNDKESGDHEEESKSEQSREDRTE